MAQALGVRGALALRVVTTSPASYLLERALPAGRGQVGSVRLGAITSELLRRQANFRRLGPSERTGLQALLQHLAVMVG